MNLVRQKLVTYVHVEAVVVIGFSHVSNIKKPYVSDVKNFVIWSCEELFKVLCWLHNLWDPNHGWEVRLFSLQKSTSELDIIG